MQYQKTTLNSIVFYEYCFYGEQTTINETTLAFYHQKSILEICCEKQFYSSARIILYHYCFQNEKDKKQIAKTVFLTKDFETEKILKDKIGEKQLEVFYQNFRKKIKNSVIFNDFFMNNQKTVLQTETVDMSFSSSCTNRRNSFSDLELKGLNVPFFFKSPFMKEKKDEQDLKLFKSEIHELEINTKKHEKVITSEILKILQEKIKVEDLDKEILRLETVILKEYNKHQKFYRQIRKLN